MRQIVFVVLIIAAIAFLTLWRREMTGKPGKTDAGLGYWFIATIFLIWFVRLLLR